MTDRADSETTATAPRGWRYSRVRRILGPIGFLAALAVLATRTCETEMAEATIAVELAPNDNRVELQLMQPNGTEQLAFFLGTPSGDPPVVSWVVQIASGDYDLAITAHGPRGTRNEKRRIELRSRATVRLRLADTDTADGAR